MFSRPNNTGARLNDYKDQIVALRGVGMTTISTEWGRKPAARCEFLAIVDGEGQDLGETLVFSKSVYQAVNAKNGEFLVGTLVEVPHPENPGHTYYLVQDLGDEDFAQAVATLESLVS